MAPELRPQVHASVSELLGSAAAMPAHCKLGCVRLGGLWALTESSVDSGRVCLCWHGHRAVRDTVQVL